MRKRSEKLQYQVRIAARKHRKELRRKYKQYIPNADYEAISRPPTDAEKTLLSAPRNFSLIDNRDEVIQYFDQVRQYVESKVFSIMDMSRISYTDIPTISLLIAYMMDGRTTALNFKRYLTVRFPTGDSAAAKLFKQVQFLATVTKRGVADHSYFLSRANTGDNAQYKLDILNKTEGFFGDDKDLSTLNPILTEIMVNTNNHADPNRKEDEPNKIPWFAVLMEVPGENKICYCIVDLGIGIHESWKMKGLKQVKMRQITKAIYQGFFGGSHGAVIRKHVPEGVDSSTGLSYRGQGLKEIYDKANEGPYVKFLLITNKAKVNFLDTSENIQDSKYNLEGTVFYWEMKIG